MKTYESMKINENRGNSWSPNSLSFFLTSHLTCRKQLEYLCRRMSRENVSSDMWWLQAEPRRPVAYVLGGRVGMDETHQVKIHFNWDNLSLFSLRSSLYPYSLLVYSSLRAECTRLRARFLPCVIFALKTCISFGAIPKKSKKRQAKTLLLKIQSTPIALAALAADLSSFSVPPLCQFSFENQWFP